mmetsp:Transcript_57382/g.150675  ORF Transcript_57382/g.150675 Transcript_57382/m.150675 type:complete len:378 (+) Transcript_57382:174-1307(+)
MGPDGGMDANKRPAVGDPARAARQFEKQTVAGRLPDGERSALSRGTRRHRHEAAGQHRRGGGGARRLGADRRARDRRRRVDYGPFAPARHPARALSCGRAAAGRCGERCLACRGDALGAVQRVGDAHPERQRAVVEAAARGGSLATAVRARVEGRVPAGQRAVLAAAGRAHRRGQALRSDHRCGGRAARLGAPGRALRGRRRLDAPPLADLWHPARGGRAAATSMRADVARRLSRLCQRAARAAARRGHRWAEEQGRFVRCGRGAGGLATTGRALRRRRRLDKDTRSGIRQAGGERERSGHSRTAVVETSTTTRCSAYAAGPGLVDGMRALEMWITEWHVTLDLECNCVESLRLARSRLLMSSRDSMHSRVGLPCVW